MDTYPTERQRNRRDPLFQLEDGSDVYYNDVLWHPDHSKVGWACKAEYMPNEFGMVTVRALNGAIPTVHVSELRKEPPRPWHATCPTCQGKGYVQILAGIERSRYEPTHAQETGWRYPEDLEEWHEQFLEGLKKLRLPTLTWNTLVFNCRVRTEMVDTQRDNFWKKCDPHIREPQAFTQGDFLMSFEKWCEWALTNHGERILLALGNFGPGSYKALVVAIAKHRKEG